MTTKRQFSVPDVTKCRHMLQGYKTHKQIAEEFSASPPELAKLLRLARRYKTTPKKKVYEYITIKQHKLIVELTQVHPPLSIKDMAKAVGIEPQRLSAHERRIRKQLGLPPAHRTLWANFQKDIEHETPPF